MPFEVGQGRFVSADPKDYVSIPDNSIRPSDAILMSNKLLEGLGELGINLAEHPLLRVYRSSRIFNVLEEMADLKNEGSIDNNPKTPWSLTTLLPKPSINVPHSILLDPSSDSELIEEHSADWTINSTSVLETNMDFAGQLFHMAILNEPRGEFPYKLSLVMPTRIPKGQEISLDQLPLDFRSVGFSLDFLRNPRDRERLSEFSERRVRMDMVSGDPRKKSGIFGRQTPNGINTISRLYLQAPDQFLYLDCYEVELFGPEGRENLVNTKEIVPESDYQEEERHFCMTGDKKTLTYPLFPLKDLGQIATLSMQIKYDDKRDDPKLIHELLRGFPLSVDGANQWYATGYLGDGKVELLSKPEWGEDNARLVYRHKSDKRISPKEIHTAVVRLSTLKKAVTERLAA